MSKSEIGILILVVAVLAGILFFLPFRPIPKSANTITNVPTSQFPESFPANIPIDGYDKILSNYNAVSPDGKIQATRSFSSVKSVNENFIFYRTFLSTNGNGWNLINEVNDPSNPDHKALFAKNANGGILSVNIGGGRMAGTSIVDLSFVATKGK